jgi:hypothetical protein
MTPTQGLNELFIFPVGSDQPWFRIKRQFYLSPRTGLWVKFNHGMHPVKEYQGVNAIFLPSSELDSVQNLRIYPARR